MNWFLRLKLAQKLVVTFLACSILTAIVGGYSLYKLNELGNTIQQIYQQNVLPSQYISEAAGRLTAHSRAYVRLPALKDPNVIKDTIKRASPYMDKFRAIFQKYRDTTLSSEEIQLIKQVDDQLPNYLAQNDKVAQLALDGKFDQAATLSNGAAREAINGLEASMGKLV